MGQAWAAEGESSPHHRYRRGLARELAGKLARRRAAGDACCGQACPPARPPICLYSSEAAVSLVTAALLCRRSLPMPSPHSCCDAAATRHACSSWPPVTAPTFSYSAPISPHDLSCRCSPSPIPPCSVCISLSTRPRLPRPPFQLAEPLSEPRSPPHSQQTQPPVPASTAQHLMLHSPVSVSLAWFLRRRLLTV
jgi:hypothetical protein